MCVGSRYFLPRHCSSSLRYVMVYNGGIGVGMDLRCIAAGLWLLSVVVVGWVSRRRLKRIDEKASGGEGTTTTGEDPVLLT